MPTEEGKDSASEDLTQHMLKYREAARHVWNCFLWDDEDFSNGMFPDGFILDRWEAIQDELFAAMVLRYTGDDTPSAVKLAPGLAQPLRFLKVVPMNSDVPAQVSRTKPAQTYWDHPVRRLGASDTLRFIGFFDWDKASYLDFEYFHVFIEASEQHPELAGHEALVEVKYVKVFLDTATVTE